MNPDRELAGVEWTAKVDLEDEVLYSRRRKHGDAWILSNRAMEEIVLALRRPDRGSHEELARELTEVMGKTRREARP